MKLRQFVAVFLLAVCFCADANAQTFLNELKEKRQGEGTVTVTQSKEIDELVNSAKLVRTFPAASPAQQNTAATQHKANNTSGGEVTHETRNAANNAAEPKRETAKEPAHEQRHTAKTSEKKEEIPAVNTSKKVMRGSRKVTGYRIQAYSGGNSRADRQKAENIGSAIKLRFPEQPIYVHFYSPRWICRVGNFRTYQEANTVLKEIKSMGYTQACIVKGKIDVGY